MNQAPVIAETTKVSLVDCPAFNLLQPHQKLYAYHFARASWAGAKICYFQRSYEAPGIMYLLQKIFIEEQPSVVQARLLEQGYTQTEVNQIFVYVAAFFSNCGNFKSFGDTKFIPELPKERFWGFIQTSKAYETNKEDFDKIWALVQDLVYNFDKPFGLIDLTEKDGQNSYYSPQLKEEFLKALDEFLHTKNISELNTRVILDNAESVTVLVGSVINKRTHIGQVQGKEVYLQHGNFSPFLKTVAYHLEQAQQYAANEHQENMLKQYVKHFNSGNIDEHKESQRYWIQDKGPVIETNIGFIETYLDPLKVRAEFEGFVAVVNIEESKILNDLVSKAEKFIKYLPWGKEFEIEKFSKPDFTSLEILAFACSGTPVGINIPNYDDIRQNDGFKNVNLGNVYGKPNRDTVRFIEGANLDLFIDYYKESLFVVVALHELIGHGCGKLFVQDDREVLNFGNVTNPFTDEPVTSFYKHNEHWHGRFGELSGAYEECKADAVALYLSTYDDVVQVLLPGKDREFRDQTVRAAWLDIIMGAIKGLIYYNAEQSKWGQPHILASYVIFQCLRQADPTIIELNYSLRDEKDYLTVHVNYEKIWTTGKAAIANLLKGLQTYKSIADGVNGMIFFNQFTKVDDEMLKVQRIANIHKQPRALELQTDVKLNEDNTVTLVTFPETHAGIIESHVFHYQHQVEDVKDLFLGQQQSFKL